MLGLETIPDYGAIRLGYPKNWYAEVPVSNLTGYQSNLTFDNSAVATLLAAAGNTLSADQEMPLEEVLTASGKSRPAERCLLRWMIYCRVLTMQMWQPKPLDHEPQPGAAGIFPEIDFSSAFTLPTGRRRRRHGLSRDSPGCVPASIWS